MGAVSSVIDVNNSAGFKGFFDKFPSLFLQATESLARSCCIAGRLDAKRLDQQQVASYELALVYAEYRAASVAWESYKCTATEVQQGLCGIYIASAAQSIRTRLEPLLPGLGIEPEDFDRLFGAGELRSAIQEFLAPTYLAEVGQEVIQLQGEVGQVKLDDDKEMMQTAFRKLAVDIVEPLAESIHRQDLTVPEQILKPLGEMGVFGISVPQQYGGTAPDADADNASMIVVTEALSEASLAAAGSLITRPEIVTRALLSGGTEAQRVRWLPQVASGEKLCGIAITEPDYGSDVAGLSLKASPAPGGWLLNGAKTWCTFAGKAQLLFVIARTDTDRSLGHKGLSALLVEKPSTDEHEFCFDQESGGRLTGRSIPTIGYRGMHSYDLVFEDYWVPEANLIGGAEGQGRGFYLAMAGLTGGRIQTAARASGVMRAALKAAVRYSQNRKVFGAHLGDYPLTRAKLARMAAQVAVSRCFTYRVGELLDCGEGQMEASLVKLFACRSAEWITREALQIHGGMGYAEETAVSRYFVDARVLSIFEGAEETLALKVVARQLLQDALDKGESHS
ncbi:acyl-CoA dehydrogenase family protein [bacterium]|nr:acyl-CoA dehydrogenase family protein [bacterium]